VGVGSEDATGSSDDDVLIKTAEEMIPVSVSTGTIWDSVDTGVGVVVGSTDVSSTVIDATGEIISTCEEATSDVASGVAAVLESSTVMVGDSVRVVKTLEELVIAFVETATSEDPSEVERLLGAETVSVAAVDSEATSSEDELFTTMADALALVANVLRYRLSIDGIVDEEDEIGSASDAPVTWDEVVEDDAVLDDEIDDESACVLVAGGALAGAIGAFAGEDEADGTDEDAGLQLPKPGWHPLPQYASVLPLLRISIQ